jgi:hypothetical protein
MAKTVFDVLNEKLDAHKNALVESLASGGMKDFAEYKAACGIIRGLSLARIEIQDLSRNFMEDDDE